MTVRMPRSPITWTASSLAVAAALLVAPSPAAAAGGGCNGLLVAWANVCPDLPSCQGIEEQLTQAGCTIPPVCGNGRLDAGEECDDGNQIGGDGCSATCANENPCGNGTIDAGEQCDDGNRTDGDGCDATCLLEPGPQCALELPPAPPASFPVGNADGWVYYGLGTVISTADVHTALLSSAGYFWDPSREVYQIVISDDPNLCANLTTPSPPCSFPARPGWCGGSSANLDPTRHYVVFSASAEQLLGGTVLAGQYWWDYFGVIGFAGEFVIEPPLDDDEVRGELRFCNAKHVMSSSAQFVAADCGVGLPLL
jgi:cysteine-rich repeat protein